MKFRIKHKKTYLTEENQYEPCFCYFCQRNELELRRDFPDEDCFTIVKQWNNYIRYSDDTEFCSKFKIPCKYHGNCSNCPKMDEFRYFTQDAGDFKNS